MALSYEYLAPVDEGLEALENDDAWAIVSRVLQIVCEPGSAADNVQDICALLNEHGLVRDAEQYEQADRLTPAVRENAEREIRAIIDAGDPARDDDGNPIEKIATCGACGRSWDDGRSSSITPTPSGRCPFEYLHQYDESDGGG